MRSLRASPVSVALVCVLLLLCLAPLVQPRPSRSRQDQPVPSQFRVIRVLCGSKGELHGTEYIMEEPKTVFHVPEDHQIVVSFEWEGPPGSHHAVGNWRSPDGKIALTSDFDLNAQGTRYVGTWTLAIPASITPGLWALEVEVDGKPAGTQTFEIASSRSDAPPQPTPPNPAQVYRTASAATALLTSLDKDGEAMRHGIAFFIDKNILLTSFQSIDGASSIRLDFADGSSKTLNGILEGNRGGDWAVLRVDSNSAKPLKRAAANSWKIGDTCYLLTSTGQGSRSIQTVTITGFQGTAPPTQRLTISAPGPGDAAGAPLLDEWGNVIGVLGGGWGTLGTSATYFDGNVIGIGSGLTALPLSSLPDIPPGQPPVSLADLAAHGAFIMPLSRDSQVAIGQLCQDFQRVNGQAILPLRPGSRFSRTDNNFGVVITWGPRENTKAGVQLLFYNWDNRPVLHTAPAKISLHPHETMYSAWKIPLASFQPGIYRLDLLLGGEPQWRAFFRVSN